MINKNSKPVVDEWQPQGNIISHGHIEFDFEIHVNGDIFRIIYPATSQLFPFSIDQKAAITNFARHLVDCVAHKRGIEPKPVVCDNNPRRA